MHDQRLLNPQPLQRGAHKRRQSGGVHADQAILCAGRVQQRAQNVERRCALSALSAPRPPTSWPGDTCRKAKGIDVGRFGSQVETMVDWRIYWSWMDDKDRRSQKGALTVEHT